MARPDRHRLRRLLAAARPYRLALVAALAAAAVASVLDGFLLTLLIPFFRLLFDGAGGLAQASTPVERFVGTVVGGLLGSGSPSEGLRVVVLLILGTVAVKSAAGYGAGYLGQLLQESVARDLRLTLFEHVQTQEVAFFHRVKGGQLFTRLLADVDQAKTAISSSLVSVLQNAVLLLVYVAILLAISWRLALLTSVLAPAVVLALRPVLRQTRSRARAALDERGEMSAVAMEMVEGARVVKAHGAEGYEVQRFADRVQAYFRGAMRTQRVALLGGPVSETLGAGVIVLLLVSGTWVSGQLQVMRPEVFLTFVVVSLRLMSPAKALSQYPSLAAQALAAADRIFEVLDLSPHEADPPTARPFPGLRKAIELRDVWVAYRPDRWALQGVRLTVRRGEVVAIVGPSGAGKSTLVDLLPRFVDAGRGTVLIDGVPVTAYGRRSLRGAIGVVGQHTVLFNDSVRNNIAYGDQASASAAQVEAAARAANAHDFITRLPAGYDTPVGERGMHLSGGERQRVAIARAILRDPPLLILDEATSNLDAESERLVQEALGRLMAHRTVLVIAHRLATVARADEIVVLDRGRVVERGRHGDLASAGGLYQRLHRLQRAG